MPALGFKKRFAPPIAAKTKQHSIRGWSKVAFPIGCTLFCYTGLRTKWCKRIGTAAVLSVKPIVLHLGNDAVFLRDDCQAIDTAHDLDHFAASDGFEDWPDLKKFWAENHPGLLQFDGRMIIWGETFRPATA